MNTEQQFFKVIKSLETHAVGVGADQATGDAIAKYPELAPHREQLHEYLTNAVRNNDLSMNIHLQLFGIEVQHG